MEYQRTRGIKIKAIAAIVIMITMVVSLMATYLIQTQVALLRNEFQKRALALTENLAHNCEYALLLEDLQVIDNLSSALLQNKDVLSVTIENISGRTLFEQSNVKNPDNSLPKSRPANLRTLHLETNDRILYIKIPVWPPHEEQLFFEHNSPSDSSPVSGYVAVKLSQAQTNAMIRKTIVTTTLIAIAVISAAIVVLILLLNRFISPLMTLVQATRELSSGKLHHRVDIQRNDELGILGHAFNEMADSLENSHRILEQHNQTLEEKVRERTEALSDSEARYRAFFESTGTAMVITEEDGTIALVNGEFEKMFRVEREKIQGARTWNEFIVPEDREKMERYEAQRILSPKSVPRHYEFQVRDPKGQFRNIFMTVSLIPGTTKKISSLIDISDKKRLESNLQQSQKMEAIGTLAGGIAHDFNNLLMGIQGYASMMLFKMKKNDKFYEFLSKIEELVQSGANLTRQILGFARGGNFEIMPSNLNEIIDKTSTMFGRTKKEIQIKKTFQEDIWTVDADRGQIEQVLLNLYVNAWHAMPGGGDLYLETCNIDLTESNDEAVDIAPGRYVKVSVTDTGVGMDEKTKERIFEPFFTTKEMGRGTGLGLAMVYGIIKGHQGAISVYSRKGKGTSFHLYFPVSGKDIDTAEVVDKTTQVGSETVLLIEDEEIVLNVEKNMLSNLGYQVICARSGQEAVDLYEKQHRAIDLVLLDMIMPGMSGSETFDRLKTINPEVRVVLCSGYSVNDQAAKIMERGCRQFLQKPFSLYDLSDRIRQALQ